MYSTLLELTVLYANLNYMAVILKAHRARTIVLLYRPLHNFCGIYRCMCASFVKMYEYVQEFC